MMYAVLNNHLDDAIIIAGIAALMWYIYGFVTDTLSAFPSSQDEVET